MQYDECKERTKMLRMKGRLALTALLLMALCLFGAAQGLHGPLRPQPGKALGCKAQAERIVQPGVQRRAQHRKPFFVRLLLPGARLHRHPGRKPHCPHPPFRISRWGIRWSISPSAPV